MESDRFPRLVKPAAGRATAVHGLRWEPLLIDSDPSDQSESRSAVTLGDSLIRRRLGLADTLGTLIAFEAAALIGGVTLQPLSLLVLCILVLAAAKILRLYDRDPQLLHKNTLDEYPKLVGLGTGVTLAASIAGPALASPDLGGLEIAVAWGLMITVLPCLRSLSRRLSRTRVPPERCLYLGNPADAAVLQVHLRATAPTSATIIGAIDVRRARRAGDREYLSMIAPLAIENGVDRVILATELSDTADLFDIVRRVRDASLKVSLVPSVSQLVHVPFEVDRLGGTALLGVPSFEPTFSTRVVKRAFDIAGASVGLFAALPILALTAIAVKLDSEGPVFYRDARAGRQGTPFTMIKFRSMKDGTDSQINELRARAHDTGLFKLANDPRITRVGAWIRKMSIDELPQLINVLRGDMSLVGPRPLAIEEDKKIGGWGRARLENVRPGMTGPWQLLGGPNRIPLTEMIKLDIQYAAGWSLWSDIRILLLTLGHMVARRGY